MQKPQSKRWFFRLLALLLCSLPAAGSAVTLTSLKGQNLENIYGSYAPRGDCSRDVKLMINESGFSFQALGRTVKSSRLEYAVSYMGPSYEGISSVFFPFPINDDNFGPVTMIVNDGEKPGVIRIDVDLPRGQRSDPFHAALAAGSPLLPCKSAAPSAAVVAPKTSVATNVNSGMATPASWTNLPTLVGRYPGSRDRNNIDLIGTGPIADAIRARLGNKILALGRSLSPVSPLQRQGSLYWVTGNAPHQGGVEQAYVLLDAARRSVQVGLWEKGKLTVYAPPGGRVSVPQDIAKLLAESPPEDAVPLPGTPWELVPVQGRPPIAYVQTAASTNIKSFSLFCEGNRPMMAVLLNKPATSPRVTVTWNFAAGLVDLAMGRANAQGTFWQANLAGSQLIPMLLQQSGSAMLRINARLEGEALLIGAPTVVRSAMRPCLKF